MKIVGKLILAGFVKKHSEMQSAVQTWVAVAEGAIWQTPHDVKSTFPKASNLGGCSWWFDLNFGGYRVKTIVNYNTKSLQVLDVLPHDDYLRASKKKK
jgi:mRNA-degrading endonuclease HigB of HigAB toxin-antitoxin module